jgi:Sucrase/ferredoxin-like
LISASSWAPSAPRPSASGEKHVEAVVFPSFLHKRLSFGEGNTIDEGDLSNFCEEISSFPEAMPAQSRDALSSQPLEYPTILMCSHNSRDTRCGVLGPLLHRDFHSVISNNYQDSLPLLSHTKINPNPNVSPDHRIIHPASTNIGMISHLGGHKWAGNVIIYIPPNWRIHSTNTANSEQGDLSPLAGMGIWYGRVEPRHVHGIVEETLLKGNVIKELIRGGIDGRGQVIRIP